MTDATAKTMQNAAQSANAKQKGQIPGFVPVSQNPGETVGQYNGDWGFFDEVWSVFHGGYADEAAVCAGLKIYVRDAADRTAARNAAVPTEVTAA